MYCIYGVIIIYYGIRDAIVCAPDEHASEATTDKFLPFPGQARSAESLHQIWDDVLGFLLSEGGGWRSLAELGGAWRRTKVPHEQVACGT